MNAPQKVQVFSLGLPPTGTAKERRRDRTRSLPTRAQADRLRSQLQVAVADGERFDTQTGLPVSWSTDGGVTWWAWSRE